MVRSVFEYATAGDFLSNQREQFEPWLEAEIPLSGFRRFEMERVWVQPTGEPGTYRLGHPPFLAAGFECGDRLIADSEGDLLRVTGTLLPGGHRSFRVLFPAALEPEELRLKLQQIEEFNADVREASNNFFVVDVSPEANLHAIEAQLRFWVKNGVAQCAMEPDQIELLSFALLDQPLVPCVLPGGADLPSVTVRGIAEDGSPVRHVVHDHGEVRWQFLPWETPAEEDARLATLQYMVQQDRSLNALAGLPIGWHAWRENPGDPWEAAPYSAE